MYAAIAVAALLLIIMLWVWLSRVSDENGKDQDDAGNWE